MINHEYSALYDAETGVKNIRIAYDSTEIPHSKINSASFRLSESLCSDSALVFGCGASATLEIKVALDCPKLIGKTLVVTETINGDTSNSFKFGEYRVFSEEADSSNQWKTITAYDALRDVLSADVTTWYDSTLQESSTMTVKQFRDAFCASVGLTQKSASLLGDSLVVKRSINPSGLSGKQVLDAICELNACFCRIGRDGLLEYVSLDNGTTSKEYRVLKSCFAESFQTDTITKVVFRNNQNDVGVEYGEDGNTYAVEGNFLAYSLDFDVLSDYAILYLGELIKTEYTPFNAVVIGNPCVECGDAVKIYKDGSSFDSFILNRELSGVYSLFDELTSDGVKAYNKAENSVRNQLLQLSGRQVTVESNFNGFKASVEDFETTTNTALGVMNGEISAKVSSGQVVNEINVSTQQVAIRGNRFVVESDNFTLDADGSMWCKNAEIEGDVKADTFLSETTDSQNRAIKVQMASNNVPMSIKRFEPESTEYDSVAMFYPYRIILSRGGKRIDLNIAETSDGGAMASLTCDDYIYCNKIFANGVDLGSAIGDIASILDEINGEVV